MNVVVRPVRWTDFSDLAELFYSRIDEVVTNPDLGLPVPAKRPTLGEEAEWFGRENKEILAGDRVAVVAEADGKVVGHATVWRKGPMIERQHLGELGIHVLPGWRGKGIGDRLMSEVLRASTGKFEIVRLSVWSVNAHAQRLYQRHGFVEYGRSPRAIKRGDRYFDQVLMWRALSPREQIQ